MLADIVRVAAPLIVALLSFWLGLRAGGTVRLGGLDRGRLGRAVLSALVVAPAVVVLAAWLLPLEPRLRLGLVVLALAPGPPLALMKTFRGEAGFAVAVEVALLALGALFVPAAVALLAGIAHREIALSPGAVASILLTRQLVPLMLGLVAGRLWSPLALRVARPLGIVVNALLAVLALALLAFLGPSVLALGPATLGTLAAFSVVTVIVGHMLGGPTGKSRLAVVTFTAMRHPGLAVLLATVAAQKVALLPIILGYALVTALILALYNVVARNWRPAATPSHAKAVSA